MELLTVNSGGDGFDESAAFTVQAGYLYAVRFKCGTADGGTLKFIKIDTDIPSDTGDEIRDGDDAEYSYDLSSVTQSGFRIWVDANGTITPTLSGGGDDETLYVSVTQLKA